MRLAMLLSIFMMLSSVHAHANAVEQRIKLSIASLFPDLQVSNVSTTPIEDIYQVMIGPEIIYMTGDARFVLKGDLLDLYEKRNLSDEQRAIARQKLLAKIPREEFIEFAPSRNAKNTVYVFTDIDCGYCRKFHADVPELNLNGIAVRYLAYPRAGINSPVHRRMSSIWCSDDRKQALTDAKSGRLVKDTQCTNPVAAHYELGQKMGIRGTPAIFLEDGRDLPGYLPPVELLRIFDR